MQGKLAVFETTMSAKLPSLAAYVSVMGLTFFRYEFELMVACLSDSHHTCARYMH